MKFSFTTTLLVGVILAVGAYALAVWILQIIRFYHRHFTDEGYLTFTLPAGSHQILLSSIINFAIWSLISVIVLYLSFWIIFLPIKDSLLSLGITDLFEDVNTLLYGESAPALQIISTLSKALYSLMLPLLSITMGAQVAKKHKLLAAFGIYYRLNTAISIITSMITIAVVINGLYAENDMVLILTSVIQSVIQFVVAIGAYFLMHHLVDKRLNLP
jgi:hypothetical protein